jgi:hypothetical protein
MNRREKLLVATVGGLLLLAVVLFAYRGIRSTINGRHQRALALTKEIGRKEKSWRHGQPIADRMEIYADRSLPSDTQAAGTLYQTWLLQSVTQVGLEDANVNAVAAQVKEGVYHQLAFTVSGRGDLRQLTRFLHKFYSVDYLHRIKRLNLKRIPDARRLDLSFSIEAMSLPSSKHEKELSQSPGHSLKQDDLEVYLKRIMARNLSGPANREPEFSSFDVPKGFIEKPVEFRVRAKDPDRWDSIVYSLEGKGLPGATLDSTSGRFQWTPKEKGRYEVTVKVTDDGLPPKSVRKSFTLEVADAPDIRPPNLEQGKSVYLTAVTQIEDRRQVWITFRSEGRLLRLLEGGEFKVGDVLLTIHRIQDKSVEMDAKQLNIRYVVSLGQNLGDGQQLPLKVSEPPAAEAKLAEAKPKPGEAASPEEKPSSPEEKSENADESENPATEMEKPPDEMPNPFEEVPGFPDGNPFPPPPNSPG